MRRLRMIDNYADIYRAYFESLPSNIGLLSEPIYDFFNFPILVPKDKNRDEILAN